MEKRLVAVGRNIICLVDGFRLEQYLADNQQQDTQESHYNVIKQMNIDNQQLLLLRYFKGYSIEEVGQNVGYTYKWAWEKIHQAEEEFIGIYEKTT